jgi:phosphopantetheinyl transferase
VFLKYWTCKEAVLKAIGSGITASLSDWNVSAVVQQACDDKGTFLRVPDGDPDKSPTCWLRPIEVHSDYVAAVAVLGAKRNIRCMTFRG